MREPRPVIRAEVSDKNRTSRIIAAVIFLVVGAVAITTGIMSLLNKDTGWQSVQISPQERSCSESFLLMYDFGSRSGEASAVNKQLEAAYTEAAVKAYQLFTPDEEIAGVNNVHYINRHPNEEITVDPVLYNAFSKLEGTRYLYLGPVYAHYSHLIHNAGSEYAAQLDPALDDASAAFVKTVADYAADAAQIDLKLLGNNRVKLHVSEEYLAFAMAEELDNHFLDFAYMTNAFIIDYLAQTLENHGLTDGYFVSVDGYTRNLRRNDSFRFNIYDRVGDMIYPAGVLTYNGPISMVYLKNYPTAESDANYRIVEDHYVHLMADPEDGMYRTAAANLVSYSYDSGCVDVLLRMLPGFIGEEMIVPEGIFSIWCEHGTICYNDGSASVGDLLKSEEISYSAELRQ